MKNIEVSISRDNLKSAIASFIYSTGGLVPRNTIEEIDIKNWDRETLKVSIKLSKDFDESEEVELIKHGKN